MTASSRGIRQGFVLMIALLTLAAAGKAILYDTLDPDCFWHMRVAEALHRQGIGPLVDDLSFASIKSPWTPYSWLAELGMKAVWDLGGYRLAVATTAMMQGGIVLVLAMIGCEAAKGRPGRDHHFSIVLLTAFGTILLLPYLSFRPATAAILILGVILWLIARDRRLDAGGPPPPRSAENPGVAGATPSNVAILDDGGPPPPRSAENPGVVGTTPSNIATLEGGGPPPPRSAENPGVAGTTPSNVATLEGGGPPPPRSAENPGVVGATPSNIATLEGGGPPPPRSAENPGVVGTTPSNAATLEGGGPPPPAASRERRPSVRWRAVWLVVPLTALLTNIHLYAVLAPVICGLVIAGAAWNRQWPAARRYGLLTAACGVACLLTPMLKGTIQTAWFYQHSDAMVAGPIIAEMRPFLSDAGGKMYAVIILLMVVLALRPGSAHNQKAIHRSEMTDWLWFGLGLVLLLRLGRFAPLFALLSMPALARGMDLFSDRVLGTSALRVALAGVLMVGCARVAATFPRASDGMDQWVNRHGPDTPGYPCAAAAFVQSNIRPNTGRLINEFTWGGYLSWRLGDQYQVLLDGRTQLYSQSFWRQTYLGDESQRVRFIQQIHADAAVLPVERSVFAPILLQNGWTVAYQDQRAQVLLPPPAQVADIK